MIIPVCLVIGGLNAITDTGQLSTDDANTHSLLSLVGRGVTPVFAPMGITQDNWPATVGLVTGVMAKEVVVGTLNTLYTADLPAVDEQETADDSIWASFAEAIQYSDNLGTLAAAIKNPLLASQSGVDVDQRVYGVMHRYFDGAVGVLAYLLFVFCIFLCINHGGNATRDWYALGCVFGGVEYRICLCECGVMLSVRHYLRAPR